MPLRLLGVALLLVGSGACALAYQLVWTRELRLVFGHSTAASAAVLAIFIGGLGAGSLLIGPRADRHPRPLALYARLEAVVALSAALSPVLLASPVPSTWPSGAAWPSATSCTTLLRLLLSALVLAVPTLLMGGTLPAAARAIEGEGDARRRATACSTGPIPWARCLGAVLATFFGLERLGNRGTLFAACALNLGVAGAAALLARRGHACDPAASGACVPRSRRLNGPPRAASCSPPARSWGSRSSCSSSSGTGCSRRYSAGPSSPSA